MTNRIEGVVRKMTNTLFRTARSSLLNTARDFSCCIVTANHEMLVMAETLPIHVICGPDLISRWLREFHPRPRRGDAFIHNSPYHGNSHAGDHCIVVPVLDDEGRQRATAVVKAHMADIGNSEPTTLMATPRDVYEEGALIFPCVKVQEGYEDVEDIIRMCMSRIRVPEDWYGDYLGMIGAARVGERELIEGRRRGRLGCVRPLRRRLVRLQRAADARARSASCRQADARATTCTTPCRCPASRTASR